MNGKMLLFSLAEGEALEKVRQVAEKKDILLQIVLPEEHEKTIGQLAMLPPSPGKQGGADLAEPMMVLCMQQNVMQDVLVALRQAGVPPICKAVLTPTNAAWTPMQLLAELQRERAEFMKMRSEDGSRGG